MSRHADRPTVQLNPTSYPPSVRVSVHLSRLEAAMRRQPALTTVRGFMEADTVELPVIHARVATTVMPAVTA